jgi:hypothetical protein
VLDPVARELRGGRDASSTPPTNVKGACFQSVGG